MRLKKLSSLLSAIFLGAIMSGPAHAATFVGPTLTGWANDTTIPFVNVFEINIPLTSLPAVGATGAVTLTVLGDFLSPTEDISISVAHSSGSASLGRILDNDPGNDGFMLAGGDVGNDYQSAITLTQVAFLINNTFLTTAANDGDISVLFNVFPRSNSTSDQTTSIENLSNSPEEFFSASITYDAIPTTTAVPLPGALPLFLGGLAMFGAAAMRRKTS